jgi:hypothetical protein
MPLASRRRREVFEAEGLHPEKRAETKRFLTGIGSHQKDFHAGLPSEKVPGLELGSMIFLIELMIFSAKAKS